MSTESVAEIRSQKCLSVLESIESRSNYVVYTLVPEKHRHTDDNKTNTFKVPLNLIKDTEDMSKLYVADSQKGTLTEVRLHYPATVKTVASGYTNPIAVAMVHGTVIVAERTDDLYCLDLHSKLQVKPASMKKAEMEAFVARHKVNVVQENDKNRSQEDLKSAINQFLQNNKKVTSNGTKLDLERSVKTPVAMTSLADEILFLADTGTKRLLEVRVEKADFKLDCYMRTVINFKDNANPTGLCIIEGQQKLLLADSGTGGSLLVVNLEDGTTLQLLQNESPDCCQIHGVCLSGQSVIFTDTKSHALKRFSFEAALLDGTNKIQKVDTIVGNGTSGTEDGLISVGRVSYPTAIIAEHGTIFFNDTSSKSVRLVTKVSALIKYIRIMEDIYRAFYIHSDILVTDVRACLTLANEYFNSEMRQVTDTPTVLDCAMNFVEAADETLKRIAWPGYICFTREKEHYELPSDFSVKYEDLLQVPQEPTTCLNKEDVKLLNDWRNEFGRGVRQQSVRNSFTKDKAGTLPFYMYISVNLHTEVDETGHDLAEATVEELFKSVSSTRSTRETDTPTQTTHNQLSAAGNIDISVLDAVPEPTEPKDGNESGHDVRLPHTGIYAIRGRSNIFSLFISSEMKTQ